MESQVELTNFTAGELSPRLKGRIDLAKYFNGCDTLVNMVVMPQGGATKRPGTLYVADAKDQAHPCLLQHFIFSTLQAYMLEFSHLNVRVYANDGQLLDAGGLPVDIAVPYSFDELAELKFTQSADTLYIWHPNHPPATLTRSSAVVVSASPPLPRRAPRTAPVTWAYAPIEWRDGPYEDVNTTDTQLNPSATNGSITITASGTAGINKGQGFLPTDVGRLIRMKPGTAAGATWSWLKITGVTDATHITADVMPTVIGGAPGAVAPMSSNGATVNWRLGLWSDTTGYPYAVCFWQQRLISGGYDGGPNVIVGSVVGDFTNMAPSQSDGVVTDAHAFVWRIDDDEVNAIRWLSPAGSAHNVQLGVGTTGGEQILQAASAAEGLSPTSVQAYRETSFGSADVRPMRIGKSVVFMERAARKIREWSFFWQLDGYDGLDLTQYSEHITRAPDGAPPEFSGLSRLAYQAAPYQVIWAVRDDGMLLSFSYDRNQTVFAPARHHMGGSYFGGPPVVESLDVIPSPDGTYDELWLSVLRTIAGVPKRFIEVLTRYFDGASQDDAFFSDAALSSTLIYPNANLTVAGLVNANPPTKRPLYTGTGIFTASAAVFDPECVGEIIRANGGKARVTACLSPTTVTADVLDPFLNIMPMATATWSLTPAHTSFGGLDHLNGEMVAILGDGASFPQKIVASGSVPLDTGKASFATIGLPYRAVLVSMPWEPQKAAASVSAGKVKRVDTLWMRFQETLGCEFGRRVTDPMTDEVTDKTERMRTRKAGDMMGEAPPLFSGIRKVAPQGSADLEGQILITQAEPLPLTVLSVFGRADIGELQR